MKYRKYSLPEEPADGPTPPDPATLDTTPPPSASKDAESGSLGPEDDTLSAHVGARVAQSRGEGWHEEGPHGAPPDAEDPIDIPGTHVPAGVVVAIVLSVVALLAATAFLLLR